MTRIDVQPLSDAQRDAIAPELQELQNTKQQLLLVQARAQIVHDRIHRMLTLIHPEMGEPESGLKFDLDKLEFYKETEDGESA